MQCRTIISQRWAAREQLRRERSMAARADGRRNDGEWSLMYQPHPHFDFSIPAVAVSKRIEVFVTIDECVSKEPLAAVLAVPRSTGQGTRVTCSACEASAIVPGLVESLDCAGRDTVTG